MSIIVTESLGICMNENSGDIVGDNVMAPKHSYRLQRIGGDHFKVSVTSFEVIEAIGELDGESGSIILF